MATDILAWGMAADAKATALKRQPMLVPVSNSRYPFSVSGVAGSAAMTRNTFYFPKGGAGIRLMLPGAYAGAAETSFNAAIPSTFSCDAFTPAPWVPDKLYQPGDFVVTLAVNNGSGVYNKQPFYTCLTSNTNSPPKPGNSAWAAGLNGAVRPPALPVTFNGMLDGTLNLQTLPNGTAVTKDLLLSDVLPVTVGPGGYLGIARWTNNSSGLWPAQNVMPGLHLGGQLARGVSQADNTLILFNEVAPAAASVWAAPMIVGVPVIPTLTFGIIGDSIANATCGTNGLVSATIVSGGTGWAVGDIFTIDCAGATPGAVAAGSLPRCIVDTVSGTAIVTARVIDTGGFTSLSSQTGQTLPTGTQSLIALSGSGTGATATVSFSATVFDYGDVTGAQGALQRGIIAAGFPLVSLSANSDRANLWAVRDYSRIAALGAAVPSDVIIELVSNDIFGTSDSAATIIANLQRIAAQCKGVGVKRVHLTTCDPATTSTTAAGQSTLVDQVVDPRDATIRQPFNALVRAVPAGFYSCIDTAAAIEEVVAGVPTGKLVPLGGLPAASDGKHTGKSAILLKAAVVTAAISKLT